MSISPSAVRIGGKEVGREPTRLRKETNVRRIVVTNNLSLDGVLQAPGRPDEDVRDGFERGGWALPYNDPIMGRVMGEGMAQTGALLLGRRTYEDFSGSR